MNISRIFTSIAAIFHSIEFVAHMGNSHTEDFVDKWRGKGTTTVSSRRDNVDIVSIECVSEKLFSWSLGPESTAVVISCNRYVLERYRLINVIFSIGENTEL